MSAEALDPMDEQDAMAAEWEAALSQQRAPASEVIDTPAEQVAPASFTTFAPTSTNTAGNDINMILDIPVQLTVELGRTRIPIDAAAQTTDRARAVVALKHPAGMAVQAKYGTLTRAAAAAGLEVNG